jgi:hypothetical protein
LPPCWAWTSATSVSKQRGRERGQARHASSRQGGVCYSACTGCDVMSCALLCLCCVQR